MAGHGGFDAAWAGLLASAEPLWLQLDGRPSLEMLLRPEHRFWLYGAAGEAYTACHLGGDAPQPATEKRAELSTEALYEAPAGTEVVRSVRVLALAPGAELVPRLVRAAGRTVPSGAAASLYRV